MPLTLVPSPRPAAATVTDLAARREATDAAVRAMADAAVRYLPAALLEALQGSWGTPEEVLGTSATRELARAR